MSEPTTPDTPSTPSTPTTDEATALALLDTRGRQAATSLRTSVGRLLAEDPLPAGTDVAVVGLRPSAGRRGQGRTWLIAAAVLVVTGLVAAIALVLQADDEEGLVSDEPNGYLVPGWLPDGWDIQDARSLRVTDVPGALTGTVTVYADPAVGDPWTGPRLSVWLTGDDGLGLDERDDVEQIQVGGLPATIEDREGTIIVRVLDGDDMVMVMADQVERSEALAASEAAVGGDVDGALPDGWERLAGGPVSAAMSTGTYALDGLSLIYGGGSSAAGQVVVIQQRGDRDDADLVRLVSPDVEVIDVDGRPAYLVEGGLLQWYDPSAQVVATLMASDVDPSVLVRFAEGLRPSRPGEIDDLVRAHGSSGPFGPLQPGEVVVTEGEFPEGHPWRLVASDDRSGGFGLTFADGAGSSGTGVDAAEGWGTLSVNIADHRTGGRTSSIGVYGAVTSQASEVVVEIPGHGAIRFRAHTVEGIDGWDHKVFAGLLPDDPGPALVVALSADGVELSRVLVDAGDGGAPAGEVTTGDDPATSETCRTLPDGGEECSASSSGSATGGG